MVDDNFLEGRLQLRRQAGNYRQLPTSAPDIDFSSNDYLGIVKHGLLENISGNEAPGSNSFSHGSTGSRLLTGNSPLAMTVEAEIAKRHDTEAALLMNSGYDANLAILSAVPQKGDTIIYDFLSHMSIRDGIRLSAAQSFTFLHNDLEDLARRLRNTTGTVFVVTESIFSMDGDLAPLQQMSKLCERSGAHLIIDEAHATGVAGPGGAGVVQALGLHEKCFARIHTFGKALGCHGAAIVGSQRLIDYLVNFARPFIYTTALPASALQAILNSYLLFPGMESQRQHLQELIRIFTSADVKYTKLESGTPIQGVIIPGNERVRVVSAELARSGLDVRPILYPTVPAGKERLRVVLHSFNTGDEVEELIARLR
jgi:8-amino-7-oxononanoate synthase